jgi:hypothetical protein
MIYNCLARITEVLRLFQPKLLQLRAASAVRVALYYHRSLLTWAMRSVSALLYGHMYGKTRARRRIFVLKNVPHESLKKELTNARQDKCFAIHSDDIWQPCRPVQSSCRLFISFHHQFCGITDQRVIDRMFCSQRRAFRQFFCNIQVQSISLDIFLLSISLKP